MKKLKIVIITLLIFLCNYEIIVQTENISAPTFSYTFTNYIGTSNISEDDAWYKATKQAYDSNQISIPEWEYEYYEYMEDKCYTEIEDLDSSTAYSVNSLSNDNSFITGRITWNVSETSSNSYQNLKYAKVELHRNEFAISGYSISSTCLGTTYTDSNGNYEFKLNSSDFTRDNINLFIKVFPESTTINVSNDWLFLRAFYISPLNTLFSFGQSKIINMSIGNNNYLNIYRMFHIHQRMIIGENFALAMGFNPTEILSVQYPFNDQIPFSYRGYCAVGKEYYNNVDGLIHEYGHFVEQQMGNYASGLIDFIMNDPNHNINDDHFVDKNYKKYAMELTWTESWANNFSLLAQEYSNGEYAYFTKYDDKSYDDYNFDTGYKQDASNACEAQEFAVSKLLWHFHNALKNKYTQPNKSYEEWWRLTTKPGTYTLEDFVNSLNTESYEIRSKVNSLLETHQIAPKLKKVDGHSLTNPPTITWIPNGSTNNPNNVFDFVFYDEEGNEVYSILGYELSSLVYNTEYSYTLSDSEWTNVKNKCCTKLKLDVVVRGYRKGAKNAIFDAESEFSGPYSSSYETISIDLYSLILRLNLPDGNQEFGFELPTFSWTATGGIDEYHNNYFKLILLDINENIWFQSMFIQEQSYTMPEDIWNNILMLGLPEIYWYVEWIQTTEYFESTITNATGYVPFSTIDTINVNTTEPYTYNLQSGECQWYKFVAPYTGTFNFYTTGDTDTYGGLFDSIICNHSYDNAIIHGDDCENDCYYKCGQSDNFCIMVNLEKDQEVYLRINGYNWTSTGEYNLYVYSEHECSFIYTNAGFNTHYCDCECGNRIIEKHVIKIGTRRCLKCRAIVTNPDLELMIDNVLYVTENGSYILSNGIIVLVEEDIENYFNGTINFYRKDEEKY